MTLANLEKILLFLVLLFLPTQLGRHFWPQFSFVYSLPIDYLSPTIYFWDLLVLALLLAWRVNKDRVSKLALNLFLFFLLTQALSLLAAPNLGVGLVRLEQYGISGLLGVYLASQKWSELKNKLFLPLLMGILFESALAILQFIRGGTLGFWILGERSFSLSTPGIAKFDFYGQQFLRPYATFPHPNMLAAFMVVTLPLLSFLRKQESKKQIIYGSLIKSGMTVVGIFLAIITTLLTVSRAALLVGFLEALFLLRKKILAWVLFLLILASPFLYTRFSGLFNFDNLSFLRREQLIGVAWQMFLSHPFLGIGLNNFIPQAADALLVGPSRFLQPVHNIFLLALSETGIIGLIGLISLLGYPIFKAFKHRNLLLLWVVVIFLGLFDHYFLTLPQGYRLLFFLWGVSLSMLE